MREVLWKNEFKNRESFEKGSIVQFNVAIIYSLQFVSSVAEFSSWGICENGILTGWGKPFFFP